MWAALVQPARGRNAAVAGVEVAVTVAVFGREARCTGSVLQGDLEGLPQVRQKCVHIRPTPLCTWPKLGETPERPQSASAQ